MKKSVKVAIIAGICVAVIIGGLALFVHFKLSDIEKNENGQESAEQIAKEAQDVLSGKEQSLKVGNHILKPSPQNNVQKYHLDTITAN